MEYCREIKSNNEIIRGVVHEPDGNTIGHAIIVHGYFSSTKLGPARLYVKIARMLSKIGYETWRFDCRGVGDSDGDFKDVTYESEIDDYVTIINMIQEISKPQEFLIIGHSMGTSIALLLADRFSTLTTKLLLLSPSFGEFSYISNLLSERQLAELDERGWTIRKSLYIRADVMKDSQSQRVFSIKKPFADIATVYGLSDEFFSLTSINLFREIFEPKYHIEIEDADHNFIKGLARFNLIDNLDKLFNKWLRKNDTML